MANGGIIGPVNDPEEGQGEQEDQVVNLEDRVHQEENKVQVVEETQEQVRVHNQVIMEAQVEQGLLMLQLFQFQLQLLEAQEEQLLEVVGVEVILLFQEMEELAVLEVEEQVEGLIH
jgi:hypothetical protein